MKFLQSPYSKGLCHLLIFTPNKHAAFLNLRGLLLALLLLSTNVILGQTTSAYDTQDRLFKKARTQRTFAWILLGGGAAVSLGGTAAAAANVWVDAINGRNSRGEAAIYTGLALMGSSVPLFLSAGKNRRRAAALTLSAIPAPMQPTSGPTYQSVPAIRVRIKL